MKKDKKPFWKLWAKTFLLIKGIMAGTVGLGYVIKESWESIVSFFHGVGSFMTGHPLMLYLMGNALVSLMIAAGYNLNKNGRNYTERNDGWPLMAFGIGMEVTITLVYILYLLGL